MGLIFLGLVALFIAFAIAKSDNPLGKFKGLIITVGFILMTIGFLVQAVRIIDAGTVGVQKLFGNISEDILTEGLHIVNPLVEIITVNTKTQNYSMGGSGSDSKVVGDAIPVLTKDGLQVIIDLTAFYKVIPTQTPEIIRSIGVDYESIIIRPIIRSKIRDISAGFEAIELYSYKREEFVNSLKDTLAGDLAVRGIDFEKLLIRKINLPESVKKSIERKIEADQEAQRMEFVLDKERQEADRQRVKAQGIADAQKIINSGLSDKLLRFEMIKVQKELVSSPNSKIIVLGDSKGSPPFIIGK